MSSVSPQPFFSNVLLIEDELSHALLIKRAIKNFTKDVAHAEDLVQAKTLIEKNSYDLIISDLNLPGSVASSTIPSVLNLADETPVIVLTSSTSINDAIAAMQAGAKDYIVKTLDNNFNDLIGLALHRVYMQKDLENLKKKLLKDMQALQRSIESGNDAVAVINQSGEISYYNTSFKNLAFQFGGEVTNIFKFITPKIKNFETLIVDLQEHLNTLAAGAVWQSEINFKDDKNLAYELALSGIRDPEDKLNACVVWIKDISENRRREVFQREILSTTTHDLKGPLGAILLSSEIAKDSSISEEKRSLLISRMHTSAQGAINLIEDMLSARRIQEGSFILRPSLCSISEIINDVVSEFLPQAENKDIQLKSIISSDVNCKVDSLGIHRAISNLVSNAIKFTEANGIVTVELIPGNDSISIKVADTGSGMEPAEVSKIFERYSRLAKHQQISGSGLGLFVLRSIINAHGGKIEVQSQLGKGTTFNIILPKEPPVNERGELISLDFS